MSGINAIEASPGLSDSEAGEDKELELLVYGNRHKLKRSKLIEAFDLEGPSDERIISVALKEMAADQRPAEAKEAVHQRLPTPEHQKCRRRPLVSIRQTSRTR